MANQAASLKMGQRFKRTPVGNIPVDWDCRPLGEIAEIVGGGTPDRKAKEYWGGSIPWATPTDATATSGTEISLTAEKITDSGLKNSAAKLMPAGSVLMSSRATIGYSLINTVPMATNQGFANFICSSELNNYFLLFLLRSKAGELSRISAGSTFLEIPKAALSRMLVQLPPLSEQRKIAAVLSAVNTNIQLIQKRLNLTHEMRAALFEVLLEKGTVGDKIRTTPFGRIPVGWRFARVPELVKSEKRSIKIGPFGSQLKKSDLSVKGYKVFGQENVIANDFTQGYRYVSAEKFKRLRSFEIFPGDLVITMMGTVGLSCIVPPDIEPGIMDSHLLRLQLNSELVNSEFVGYCLHESDAVKKQIVRNSQGGIMSGLNSAIIRALLLPLPPKNEQERIVSIMKSTDGLIRIYIQQIEVLKKSLAALQSELISGRIRLS